MKGDVKRNLSPWTRQPEFFRHPAPGMRSFGWPCVFLVVVFFLVVDGGAERFSRSRCFIGGRDNASGG
jgi:hypothetical protein